jgi:integration host factor subunit beta
VTKSELIAEFAASNPHLRQEDVELVVTIFDQIAGALARGDRVELRGFGAFTAKWRRARTGRNPRSGEEVPVSEKVLPYFRISRKLHRRLNRSDAQDRAASTVRTARRRLRLGHQHGEEVAALAAALLHHAGQGLPVGRVGGARDSLVGTDFLPHLRHAPLLQPTSARRACAHFAVRNTRQSPLRVWQYP